MRAHTLTQHTWDRRGRGREKRGTLGHPQGWLPALPQLAQHPALWEHEDALNSSPRGLEAGDPGTAKPDSQPIAKALQGFTVRPEAGLAAPCASVSPSGIYKRNEAISEAAVHSSIL